MYVVPTYYTNIRDITRNTRALTHELFLLRAR